MEKEDALRSVANRLRHHVLRMTTKAGSGHATTCLSMAELMACIFFDEMRFDAKSPRNPANDEFVLSKGHASPILWAAYAEAGIIPFKKLESYRQFGSPLEGHPTPRMSWVKAATGSLGQGLSVGLGMALAMRLQGVNSRVFVMLGDGECAEGSVWEAAALAAKYNTSNLVAIVDANRLGQSGESLHGRDVKRWKEKWRAFGWEAVVIDGHDVPGILSAFAKVRSASSPSVIIANTVKGKGVSFLEDKKGWHGKALSAYELKRALAELPELEKMDAGKLVRRPEKRSVKKIRAKKIPAPKYSTGQMVATREAYGTALQKLGEDERIVALDGDVKNSTFSEKFKTAHPARFFDCYIAEQNMAGMAVGFSARGFVPFASTFGAFFTRAHDQVRMAAISGANVKFSGSHVGVSIGEDGPSQMGLEDLSLFRCIPESIVLYPCDAVSAERCTGLLAKEKCVGYLRTSRPKTPVIYRNGESFVVGGSKVLRKSKRDRAVIIAAGVTVHEALKAYGLLKRKGVSIGVVDAYSVKPFDARTIKSLVKDKRVVVVEDHYPEGGLGEAVASLGLPIVHLAVREIPRSGKPEILLERYRIDAKAIVSAVMKR